MERVEPYINEVSRSQNTLLMPGGPQARNFSIVWTGTITFPASGSYQFATCGDDGMRVFIDGSQVVAYWNDTGPWLAVSDPLQVSNSQALRPGVRYPIRVEYYQNSNNWTHRLLWKTSGDPYSGPTATQANCHETMPAGFSLIPPSALDSVGDRSSLAMSACHVQPSYLPAEQIPNASDAYVKQAMTLFQRLAGYRTSLADSRILTMSNHLREGRGLEAARVATSDPSFYDRTVAPLFRKMGSRGKQFNSPLTDFVATGVGITRDQIPATKLLTGNFLYRGRASLYYGKEKEVFNRENLINTNNHYAELERTRMPLACAIDEIRDLNQIPGSFRQLIARPNNALGDNPTPAGVLSSRAWMEAHAVAGTNRRLWEQTLEEFLCTPMTEARDSETPDIMVRRDVDRQLGNPGGLQNYMQNCKTCHAGMDAMASAFNRWDWFTYTENGIVKGFAKYAGQGYFYNLIPGGGPEQPNENANNMKQSPVGIARKTTFNSIFPDGYSATDDAFINFYAERANGAKFQFDGPTTGQGMRDLGLMVARAGYFATCMAKKVYSQVCQEEVPASRETWIQQVGSAFANQGYNMKSLFETVGVQCSR